jgi:hypothetical protein
MRGLRMIFAASRKRRHRFLVNLHSLLRLRLQETLAGLVIARCAQEAGRRREPVPLTLSGAAARLNPIAHARPFFEPGVVVANLVK